MTTQRMKEEPIILQQLFESHLSRAQACDQIEDHLMLVHSGPGIFQIIRRITLENYRQPMQ